MITVDCSTTYGLVDGRLKGTLNGKLESLSERCPQRCPLLLTGQKWHPSGRLAAYERSGHSSGQMVGWRVVEAGCYARNFPISVSRPGD